MSNSTKGRIRRGPPPEKVLTDANYRKYALPALRRDFADRCAYSMQHRNRAGGSEMLMEIDHFDPTLKNRQRHRYSNLFLASRYCNNKKQGQWPSREARAKGVRFLNCCKEQDYGEHIFENPVTHQLAGVTPAGRYHIRMLDLNAPHLIAERAERSEFHRLLYVERKIVKESAAAMHAFHEIKRQLDFLIPLIPSLP
ncbi:MAG: hypothetical protein M3Q89_06315 [Verrucomicrobiota bacterium]|nr:hypothetical protein [Verrucomicrobiota bacterium]